MNKLKYMLGTVVLLCLAGCKSDPWEDVADGKWNHERSIVDIKFQGQAGTPVITNLDGQTGEVELQLATDQVADMSKVQVEVLTLSYNASGSVATGGTLDFTQGDPTIVVSSVTGEVRTYTLRMTEFTETLTGTYIINNLWLWGGTGPEWDCTKLYKPNDKSWCWDDKGRGPSAEMDNYLVFTMDEILANGNTTGTCTNWAGVDAKNWNSVYAANPDTGKPLDLTNFYRQIPKGVSKWVRNYIDGTVTFTDSKGRITTGTLVSKGTYDMPNTPPIPLTLANESLKFNLKGVDYWTSASSDYDVFASNPRSYYIEMVKQPAGFQVPEASKTVEVEVAPEPEPEPEPESTSLEGTYAIGRLTVYGGTDSPDFIGPVDKSWVWDDTIWKESDNMLIMTVTGKDKYDRETGTANYTSGADGAYWNYIYQAAHNPAASTNVDLTKFYCMLPHGESKYLYDADAGMVTFTVGATSVTAKVLKAGDHTYGSKTLSVAGIAFDFVTPGKEVWGDHLWTDYDRFAVCPRNYVMLFNKQETPAE